MKLALILEQNDAKLSGGELVLCRFINPVTAITIIPCHKVGLEQKLAKTVLTRWTKRGKGNGVGKS